LQSLCVLALAALVFSVPCYAQVDGYWQAASDTTADITGDISFAKSKITINFSSFPVAEIRDLKPAEVSSVFDVDLNAGGIGSLYRLNIPARQRFLHKNTLCGTEDTQWMVTFTQGKVLHIAFFSGPEAPTLTFDAMQNSYTHCATFIYVR
ncbi:MAG TPA: hypothetical protein VG844_03265, partial [Terracidiphilus sp.]|nr:hypothetical protein [Terracidiphilus sp.]